MPKEFEGSVLTNMGRVCGRFRVYPEFMAAFVIRTLSRRCGSSPFLPLVVPAVAVDDVCCEVSEYVDTFEAAEDQRRCVDPLLSGPSTSMLGMLGSSGDSSIVSSKMVVGVSGGGDLGVR